MYLVLVGYLICLVESAEGGLPRSRTFNRQTRTVRSRASGQQQAGVAALSRPRLVRFRCQVRSYSNTILLYRGSKLLLLFGTIHDACCKRTSLTRAL